MLLEFTLLSMCGMEIPSMQGTHGRWGQWLLEVSQSCAGNGHAGLPPAHFWCWHQAKRAPRHLSGFYCMLMFSSWPCHPQDVFPSPLIRLTSCSCFKDTNSVGCTSDRGLSHLPIYSLDSCVPEARGLYLSWIAGAPKFHLLFSEHCVPSKTGLKVVPFLQTWQGQIWAISFKLV